MQSILMKIFAEQIIIEIVVLMLVLVAVDPWSDIANGLMSFEKSSGAQFKQCYYKIVTIL